MWYENLSIIGMNLCNSMSQFITVLNPFLYPIISILDNCLWFFSNNKTACLGFNLKQLQSVNNVNSNND